MGLYIHISDMVGIGIARTIDDHSVLLSMNVSVYEPIYQNYSLTGKVSTLNISITIYCSENHYGRDCTTYCFIEHNKKQFCNKSTGQKQCMKDYFGVNCTIYCHANETDRYTCNVNTGEKICFQDYYGVNCTVYCRTNGSVVHFMCNQTTGDKICSKDYYDNNCTKYCKPPDINPHYHCNRTTGGKICVSRWSGVECNISLFTLSSVWKGYIDSSVSDLKYTKILSTSFPSSIAGKTNIKDINRTTVSPIGGSQIHLELSKLISSSGFTTTAISLIMYSTISTSIEIIDSSSPFILPTSKVISSKEIASKSFTDITSAHPSLFRISHSSIYDFHKTSASKRKSGSWITSTAWGIFTLCLVIIFCIVVTVVLVLLFLRDR